MENTKISIVYAQLNEGKPFEKMILIENENGKLLVDRGLFSISILPYQQLKIKIKPII